MWCDHPDKKKKITNMINNVIKKQRKIKNNEYESKDTERQPKKTTNEMNNIQLQNWQ